VLTYLSKYVIFFENLKGENMPQRRAAKKDLRKNIKRHKANLLVTQGIKSAIKKFKKSIENKDLSASKEALKTIYKVFDKAASKRLIHPNKAARKKSHLSKILNKLNPQAHAREKAQ
jgi:small subunit ribosomal protein S20